MSMNRLTLPGSQLSTLFSAENDILITNLCPNLKFYNFIMV